MKRARENHHNYNNGHSHSPREKAKVARDSKNRWANDQSWAQLADDQKRAYSTAKNFRSYMGYENSNPSFDEVIKVLELFHRTREHVWAKCDLESYLPEVQHEDVKVDTTSNGRYDRHNERSYDEQEFD